MIMTLAVIYVIVLMVSEQLDRLSVEPDGSMSGPRAIIWFIARNRWFWIPPLYLLALFVVVIVTLSHGDNAAQLMYRSF